MNEPPPEGAPAASARRRRGDSGRRERLLEMATREFAAKGLAGARVDAIARAARSNKQLVYYYFGNKIGLYNEIVGRIGPAVHEELYPDLDDDSLTLAERVRRRATHTWGPVATRWARLLGWEALERGDKDILREQQRYDDWRHRTREIEAAQARGEVDPELDAEMLGLALLAVELFPRVLPQITKIVTGLKYTDDEFRRRQEELLVALVEHVRPTGPQATGEDPSTSR
ncbi:MAG: TetR/AcrR family transcriptional regulator [Solirubrobacteraceae bacterium]|nr:TetR/AcrR family transcriptional regulator [Solirubrobacteraceae bacterium]